MLLLDWLVGVGRAPWVRGVDRAEQLKRREVVGAAVCTVEIQQ